MNKESSLIVIGKLTKVKGIAENPNGTFNNVDLNKEIQLNKEYLFYLDLNTGGFSHLKEKYYGLISFKQGLLAADLYK